jgi:hypothetical protein
VSYLAGAAAVALVTGAASLNLDRVVPPEQAPPPAPDRAMRAFSPDSWWNTPLPDNAPTQARSEGILHYLRTGPENGNGCLKLAGVGDSHWGNPIYWVEPTDPEYNVDRTGHHLPRELKSLRIPVSARPSSNNDGTMTIFDVHKGYVVALTDAQYASEDDSWSATGATVTYLDSNGLHKKTGRSDDPRNTGTHRGNNGATMAVIWDQVQAGEIAHVLKIASGPPVSSDYIFPMVGSDGQYKGSDPDVPPEGLRLRIKPSVDLESMGLDEEALIIARALQKYGAYIGDSGGRTALKVENTWAEGRGHLWRTERDALCALPFKARYWDVVAETYDPSGNATGR